MPYFLPGVVFRALKAPSSHKISMDNKAWVFQSKGLYEKTYNLTIHAVTTIHE
jgi:hypothetical protein